MKASFLALALALVGCGDPTPARETPQGGDALERAALASGIVSDPAGVVPTGVYGSGEDKVCVVPLGDDRYRFGASVDLGEQQHCTARGIARGRGKLDVRLGQGVGEGCEFVASLDGDLLSIPAVLPGACDTLCEGRATLAALSAQRLSDSVAEATRVEGPDGQPLCAG